MSEWDQNQKTIIFQLAYANLKVLSETPSVN